MSCIEITQVTTYFGDEDGIDLEVMAALLGKIDQFDPEQEEWPQYVERLNRFFEANDLTGNGKATKQRATFLTVIGPGPYKLLSHRTRARQETDRALQPHSV